MFALIHFRAITGTGIHIDNSSNQVAIYSAYAILHIELVLFGFGLLPIVDFVTSSMTRGFRNLDRPARVRHAELTKTFVLGRFLGALILAIYWSRTGRTDCCAILQSDTGGSPAVPVQVLALVLVGSG